MLSFHDVVFYVIAGFCVSVGWNLGAEITNWFLDLVLPDDEDPTITP